MDDRLNDRIYLVPGGPRHASSARQLSGWPVPPTLPCVLVGMRRYGPPARDGSLWYRNMDQGSVTHCEASDGDVLAILRRAASAEILGTPADALRVAEHLGLLRLTREGHEHNPLVSVVRARVSNAAELETAVALLAPLARVLRFRTRSSARTSRRTIVYRGPALPNLAHVIAAPQFNGPRVDVWHLDGTGVRRLTDPCAVHIFGGGGRNHATI